MTRILPPLCSLLFLPTAFAAPSFSSLEEAVAAARFSAQLEQEEGGAASAAARNPVHGFSCAFDAAGLRLAVDTPARGFHSAWTLRALERTGARIEVGEGTVRADGRRVEITRHDGALVEWFENGAAGLEHGFTLRERPLKDAGGRLRLLLAVEGDLVPRLDPVLEGIALRDAKGETIVRYDKLKVWDADGKIQPASFSCEDGVVGIEVDDAGAVYPLVIDPLFSQQAFVKASNTGTGDLFGTAVAISGNTAVVGAPNEDSSSRGLGGNQGSNAAMDSGAVYVFERADGLWTQTGYLKSFNSDTEDDFGFTVAVEGDMIVVGAPDESSGASTVNGNSADNSFGSAGAVYVFKKDFLGLWQHEAYLKASNSGTGDNFGCSLAFSGNTVVVGAPFEDSTASGVNGDGSTNTLGNSGAAYVFVRAANGTWTQQAFLKASQPDILDNFGHAVGISGNIVIVGAPSEDSAAGGINGNAADNGLADTGAAYVFSRSGSNWTQQAYLKAALPVAGDKFGTAVAATANRVVVGAPLADGPGPDEDPLMNSGAAYVFDRVGIVWSQSALLLASNADAFDEFGHAVAVEGDALAVSAWREDSAATGTGGDPLDDTAMSSGAVYVFERDASAWSQRAYLKASNTGANDEFGTSVHLSGDTVIVGAAGEDSGVTGINPSGASNNFGASGASYIFTGVGSPPFVPPVLAHPVVDGSGDWTVSWTSTPGLSYTLQRSHDLIDWMPVATVEATDIMTSQVDLAIDAFAPTYWRVLTLCD